MVHEGSGGGLTDKSYWDSKHAAGVRVPAPRVYSSFRRWLRYIGRSYSAEHFWKAHLERWLEPGSQTVIEIGSAPGEFLKEFYARLGYDPYGVDYSPMGAEINRANFKLWGLDPGHVFESDAFASEFQSRHRSEYDVVVSRGLIEHVADVRPALEAHLNILKPGGALVIAIPNYYGLNYALGLLTVRDLYPHHNLELMRPGVFRKIFDRPDLGTIFCGPIGGFDLGLLEGGAETPFTRRLLKLTRRVQWGLNILFRTVFFNRVPETRYTSPFLLYMGRKLGG